MTFKKIFTGRLDSGSTGQETTYVMPPSSGGRSCKVVQFMVKVLQASSTTNVRISVDLYQSPDGTVSTLHSTAISSGDPGATFPSLLTGDCDTSKIVGEVLIPRIRIKDSATTNAMSAVIELYELRKPF